MGDHRYLSGRLGDADLACVSGLRGPENEVGYVDVVSVATRASVHILRGLSG